MTVPRWAIAALVGPAIVLAAAVPAAAATTHHPKASISQNHKVIHLGSTVSFTGTVAPNEHGHPVHLQRYYGTSWHNVATATLSSGSHYRISVKPHSAGTYTYRVHDYARPGWSAASTRTVKVTVEPKAAAAACHPLTDGGKCYEPGEFCRVSDHGQTGVAGDGKAIKCEDDDGWRWEPV